LDEAIGNVHAYAQLKHPHEGELTGNSMGMRLQFWQNTISLIAKHPLLGTGTGSLHREYGRLVAGTDTLDAVNPHNEYLGVTAQLGLVGLILLLAIGVSAWRDGMKLPSLERDALQALIVTMAIGSLFNSLLLDVNEGRFFVVMLGLLLAGVANQATSSSFALSSLATVQAPHR
jgi:O-antigen ligase